MEICPAIKAGQIIEFKLDESNPLYLRNWQDNPDIMCRDVYELSLIPAMYAMSYAVGGVFFFMPDKVGRRLTMLIFSIVSMVAQLAIYFSPVFMVKVAAFGVYGLA